jgi:hypothetical protein
MVGIRMRLVLRPTADGDGWLHILHTDTKYEN